MTQRRLKMGAHFSLVTFHRELGPMRVWEFRHQPGSEIPAHQHARAHLLLVLGGSFGQIERGALTVYRRGHAMLHPRGAGHSNRFGPEGAQTLAIEFEADDLPRLMPAGFAILGRDVHLEGVAVDSVAAAARRPDCELKEVVHSLLARVAAERARAPVWLSFVKAELDRASDFEPDIRRLAAAVGRHPAHLMREFRRHVGVPIGEYARSRRIARSCEDLRRPGVSLSDIAVANGFADQSHFTRTFRRFMNMTPNEYRKFAGRTR